MTLVGTVCPACYTPSWDMAAPIVELTAAEGVVELTIIMERTSIVELTAMESVVELTSIMESTSIVELTAIVETWLSPSWNLPSSWSVPPWTLES